MVGTKAFQFTFFEIILNYCNLFLFSSLSPYFCFTLFYSVLFCSIPFLPLPFHPTFILLLGDPGVSCTIYTRIYVITKFIFSSLWGFSFFCSERKFVAIYSFLSCGLKDKGSQDVGYKCNGI